MDQIDFTIEACDSGTVLDCENCQCRTITARIDVKEKNKSPIANAAYDGYIKEYMPPVEGGESDYVIKLAADSLENLPIVFNTANSVQFKSLYFCEITDSDNQLPSAESSNGDFHVRFGNQIAKRYDQCEDGTDNCGLISDNERISLYLEKSADNVFSLDRQVSTKYTFRVLVCSGQSS